MSKNKYLNESIKVLNLDEHIIKVLEENNIITIQDLWSMNRAQLKELNLSDSQINQTIIKLQLIGLDINKRIYH